VGILDQVFPTLTYKSVTVYFVLIFFALLYKKNAAISLIVLSSLALITISASFGIMGGIVLMVFYSFFLNKSLSKQNFYFILLYLILLGGFIVSFYTITGIKEKNTYSVIEASYILKHIITSFHIIIKTPLEVIYLYFPYIMIAGFFLFGSKKIAGLGFLFKTLAFTFISSLFAWAITYEMENSVQLFSIIVIPFINICIISLLIAYLYELRQNLKKLSILLLVTSLLIVTSMYNSYSLDFYILSHEFNQEKFSSAYINSIKSIITYNPMNPVGIFIKAKSDYLNVYYDKNPNFSTLGNYLKFIKPGFNTVSLSVFDTPMDTVNPIYNKRDIQTIESSVFFKFVDKEKQSGKFKTIQQSQVDFIKAYHIKYCILSKNAVVSENMKEIISRTFTDGNSGERFVVF
jgi:hypothetical protein